MAENIDIVAIYASFSKAKNCASVTVVVDPSDYVVLGRIVSHHETTYETRQMFS